MKKMIRILETLDDVLEVLLIKSLTRPKVLLPVVALALAGWAWSSRAPAPVAPAAILADSEIQDLLLDKPWLDKMPKDRDDHMKLYFFTRDRFDRAHRIGVRMTGNLWKREIELFAYRVEGGKLHFFWPYDKSKSESGFEVKNGADDADFDLTMVLAKDPRQGGKRSVYYSRTDWEQGVDAFIGDLLKQLPHWRP